MDKESIWQEILESLKVSVSPAIFSTWFSQTHLSKIKKAGKRHAATIGCSSSFVKGTIENRYFGLIQSSLSKIVNTPVDLLFVVEEIDSVKSKTDKTPSPLFESNNQENLKESLLKSRVRPSFTFENYAVSSSNQMAWAAAEAVSKNLGNAYNPLFLWGGVGVGKTHLMNAVGFTVINKKPDSNVYFCSGEEFTNDIVEGIRNKTTQRFRNKYRKLDALLIDDIQFIAGKNAVQEEFFHTFNALVSAGGQIILTSDRPPSDIAKLEERLRSRFEAGLIIDITSPDFELRCAIIQIKATERSVEIPMDLVQLIAGNINSPRRIEGFLVKLSSELKLNKSTINEALIQNILGKGIEPGEQRIKATPPDLIKAVSNHFSIGKRMLLGPSRARPVAHPRQILMYLLRTHLGLPLQEVGRVVGGRDHTTVMHAVNKITLLASQDVQIRQDIMGIKNSI